MSSGLPKAISAERRTFPATTTDPMMLPMSKTSTEVRCRPTAPLSTAVIFSMPSTKMPGPEAFPPIVRMGAPAGRMRLVLYVR